MDTTGIVASMEALLENVNLAIQHAQAAVQAMEAFPDLDNERRRLEGILGVLGSMAYSAQCSPLVARPLAPGQLGVGAPS